MIGGIFVVGIAAFAVIAFAGDGAAREWARLGMLLVSAVGGWWMLARVWGGERDMKGVRQSYIASGQLPCPRCTYPLEEPDEDADASCPECGWAGDLGAARRAWHRVLWIRSRG